jgi:DHA1 family bicyclomycin/chloramphenicol resistance-like MFS transporter
MPAVPRYATTVGSRVWIITLAALTGVVALSIDMSLPAQPTLAERFDVSSETAQLTLSLFLIGFAGAQLFVGYLSDAWGRRRVMLGGLALFTVAGVACTLAPTIEILIAMRVLQGIGASAAPVVARAMVRDTQPAAQAARLLSTMLAALALAPMVGPLIGGVMLRAVGWRAIFASLAVCGVVLFAIAYLTLVETMPAERRARPSIGGLMRSYGRFFATTGTKLPMLIGCASFAGQFAYIADSPFVLMDGYRVSADHFGFYFGTTAFALMLGSLTGGRLLRAGRSPGVMTVLGSSCLLVGGIAVAIGTRLDIGIAGFMVPMILYFFGTGIVSPSATAMAMEPVPQIAGTASAAIGASTMTAGAIAGYETTRIGGSDPTIFSLVVVVMGTLAFVLAITAAVMRHRRRIRS